MAKPLRALLAAIGIGIAAGLLRPDAATGQAVVRGVVRSDSSGRRIFGARVSAADAGHTAESNGQGQYVLGAMAAGSHRITVQAIGHRPLDLTVLVDPGDTLEVDLSLAPVAVRLADVSVTAAGPRRMSTKMEEVERRKRLGFGRFVTREDLKGNESLPLSTVLRPLVGLQMVVRPFKCGGGFAAATGRGGSQNGDISLACPGLPPAPFIPACYVSVYVDGIQMWAWDRPDPPNINDYLTGSIEAIEVYRGPGELPAEFQTSGSLCGAILIWTRTGETQ